MSTHDCIRGQSLDRCVCSLCFSISSMYDNMVDTKNVHDNPFVRSPARIHTGTLPPKKWKQTLQNWMILVHTRQHTTRSTHLLTGDNRVKQRLLSHARTTQVAVLKSPLLRFCNCRSDETHENH